LVITSIMAVSFFQVIARYGFNTGWSGALEFNTTAFSWLIILGMGYGLRTSLHLGVDIIIKAVPAPMTKALSLLGAACCLLYGLVLLDSSWVALFGVDTRGGAIDYWLKMYKIGIGSEELHYPGIRAGCLWYPVPYPPLAAVADLAGWPGADGIPLLAGFCRYRSRSPKAPHQRP
jgi:C4-dicarboxylate transporter DctQ subunit